MERPGNLPEEFISSKRKTKLPSEEWIVPAASTIKPEERESVVDSGASMHSQQQRSPRIRFGDREGIDKSDGGNDSQRRSASKRRGNGVRP